MYIKALTFFIASLLFHIITSYPLLSMREGPDEDPEEYGRVTSHLSPSRTTKFQRFLRDPTAGPAIRLFADYFSVQRQNGSEVYYLSNMIDVLDEQHDLGVHSRLSFFTAEIFHLYIPQRTFEFTEAQSQFGVFLELKDTIIALRALDNQQFLDFTASVQTYPNVRSSPSSLNDYLSWYTILPMPSLLRLFNSFSPSPKFANWPFGRDQAFFRHISQIASREVRGHIVTLFASGLSNGFSLTEGLVKQLVPTLSQMTLLELEEIQTYFRPEVLEIVKERKIFLPVLDRLLHRIESRTLKTEGWDKYILVNKYVPCSLDERRRVMEKLTPAYLSKSAVDCFFTLSEDMDAEQLQPENTLRKFLGFNLGRAPHITSVYRAPTRWYPLIRMALVHTQAEFDDFEEEAKKSTDSSEMHYLYTNDVTSEFPDDLKFKHNYSEITRYISSFPKSLTTWELLRTIAYIYFEFSDTQFPRLRSPNEISTLLSDLNDTQLAKTLPLPAFWDCLRTAPSPRLQNEFWQDVASGVKPVAMKFFARVSSSELDEIEAFFTPEKVRGAKDNEVFYQILERFACYNGSHQAPTTVEERIALRMLLTDQFIASCRKGKFDKLALNMGRITPKLTEQLLLLCRDAVIAFGFTKVVKAVLAIPGEYRKKSTTNLTEEDRERILPSLTDEFFQSCPDFDFFYKTLRILNDAPTTTHSFVIRYLQSGFMSHWIARIIGFGSFDVTPQSQARDSHPQYQFKVLVPRDMDRDDLQRIAEEDRMALVEFLTRLNSIGIRTHSEVEEVLSYIAPSLFGDKEYYLEISRCVFNAMGEDVLRTLQTKENIIRFIRLIYGEPAEYLQLRERLIDEVANLLDILSQDNQLKEKPADALLDHLKRLRYDSERRTFAPAAVENTVSPLNDFEQFRVELRKIQLRNHPDKWFYE